MIIENTSEADMSRDSFPLLQPRIAVFLAAYNGMAYIAEQVKSILEQSDCVITIFVSVDRSSDGTEGWIDKLAKEDSRILVLPHGKHFGGAARNFFRLLKEVDFTDFDYVSFADQDDIWFEDKLARAHQVLLRTGADAYSSNVVAFWSSGRRSLIKKSQPQKRWDFLFEAAGPGCTYVMKVGLAGAIQALLRARWDEAQKIGLHDWFSYAFARANGYRWAIDEYAGMLYRQHDVNQVGVNAGWRAFLYRSRKVLNGWGLSQAALISQLVGLNDEPFVRRWLGDGRCGLLWLALHAGQCRRVGRDRILFAFSCMLLCITSRRFQ